MYKKGAFSRDYSEFNPLVLKKRGRLKVARQILGILKAEFGRKSSRSLKVLDVGCSSGIISNFLAEYFGKVYAIDIDIKALTLAKENFKKKNLTFSEMDATNMVYPDNFFDVVIANQVYMCFPKPGLFMRELYRVLKPGGISYFGARNKYTLWDGQYHLPLLAFMPKGLADLFVKITRRAESFTASYRSFWQLQKLCGDFVIERYTPKILNNPQKYNFKGLAKFGGILSLFSEKFWEILEPTLPNFIWILKKPKAA